MKPRAPIDPREAWTALALGVDPVTPAPHLRERLLAAADRALPFRPHLPAFAACFDLGEPEVHELLARMDDPAQWTPGLGATRAFLHFDGGPRIRREPGAGAAHCGVTRMKHGARIPLHTHKGREVTFVLRGEIIDESGARFGPGSAIDMAPGSAHAIIVQGTPEALLAVRFSEIEIVPPA
jgi:quercetin dioxygenase-like cupin family protein